MRRKLPLTLLIGAMSLMVVTPAQAAPPPPTHERIPFSTVVEDFVPECDRTLSWDIDGVSRVTRFFNEDGSVRKTISVITELNTITDVDNDVTLREGPDAFVQIITFNQDGSRIVEFNGLSVLVLGGVNTVIDVGRLKLLIHPDPDQNRILHQSGRHDIRSIAPFVPGAQPVHLKGFCPAFV